MPFLQKSYIIGIKSREMEKNEVEKNKKMIPKKREIHKNQHKKILK